MQRRMKSTFSGIYPAKIEVLIVTVKEVAKRLEISQSLVYQLVAAGKLRGIRHGMGRGCIRIGEEDIADYLKLAGEDRRVMPLRHIR